MSTPSSSVRLAGFMAKYTPEVRREAKKALAAVRQLLPGAVEMVYDNYNGLVIGFGPTERASEAIISLVLFPRWVTLCFLEGVTLCDPDGVLRGSGNQVRHVRLESSADVSRPEIVKLIRQAAKQADTPIDPRGRRRMVIKSVSPRQRPRRPAN